MTRASLFPALAFAAAIAVPWTASARDEDPCAAAAALAPSMSSSADSRANELTVEEVELLQSLCEMQGADAAAWRASSDGETRMLDDVTRRVLASPTWSAALVAQLLPNEMLPEVGGSINSTCSHKAQLDASLHAELARAAKQRQSPDPKDGPFSFDTALNAANGKATRDDTCRLQAHHEGPPPANIAWLSVLAPQGYQLRVLVGGSRPQQLRVTPFHIDGMALTQRTPDEPVLYMLPLPSGASFVLTAHLEEGPATIDRSARPIIVRRGVASPMSLWAEASSAQCVDLRIATPETAQLYVDGIPASVPRRAKGFFGYQDLPNGPHQITVLEPGEGSAPPRVLLDVPVQPPPPEKAHVCQLVAHDLTRRGAGDTIGILEVSAPSCVGAGIDAAKVSSYLRAYLRSRNKKVGDLGSWSHAVSGIANLRDNVRALGGTAVGADRGELDSLRNLAAGSEELLRQGFESLLAVRLQCSKRPTDWDYSVVAEQIRLDELSRRAKDPITGVDLNGIVRSEIELARRRDLIAQTLDLALSRLLDSPTITVDALTKKRPFHAQVTQSVEAYLPKNARYSVITELRPISDAEAPSLCSRLTDRGELRQRTGEQPFAEDPGWLSQGQVELEPVAGHAQIVVELNPTKPSWTLVRTTLLEEANDGALVPKSTRYQCYDFSRDRFEVSVDLFAWFSSELDSEMRDESYNAIGTFLGAAWNGWGGEVGYSHTWRRGTSLPSWDDVVGQLVDPNQSYLIEEHAVYAGFHPHWYWSMCELLGWTSESLCVDNWRRVSLRLGGRVFGGVHFIDKDQVPDEFVHFKGDEFDTKLDVGGFLNAGFGLDVTSYQMATDFWIGSDRWVDFFRDDTSVANVDQRLLFGASIGVAW